MNYKEAIEKIKKRRDELKDFSNRGDMESTYQMKALDFALDVLEPKKSEKDLAYEGIIARVKELKDSGVQDRRLGDSFDGGVNYGVHLALQLVIDIIKNMRKADEKTD